MRQIGSLNQPLGVLFALANYLNVNPRDPRQSFLTCSSVVPLG
jgi:hypothetical protein